jgi:hypothetical protein
MSKVHIELKRVQRWLFSIPRLRAMVGANALLGETLRAELPNLLHAGDGRRWKVVPQEGAFPSADLDDPLKEHDDPRRDAERGILSRDGGHFEACFEDDEAAFRGGASRFAEEAAALLRSRLADLPFKISLSDQRGQAHQTIEAAGEPKTYLSAELPVLSRCAWTSNGLASAVVRQGEDEDEVSLAACYRHGTARFIERGGQAQDLVTLLMRHAQIPTRAADTSEELAEGKYLAVIHADGNDVGAALPRSATEAERAAFHHRNRVLMRRALHLAITEVKKLRPCRNLRTYGEPRYVFPLLPLMLGGDDLLAVCRSDVALPFIVDLCAALEHLQVDVPKGQFKLTLGIGVAIASYSLPFHHLHELAEALASSAKRKVRGTEKPMRVSVVDWMVSTASLAESELATSRRRDWLRGSASAARVLSMRPLPVLKQTAPLQSLQGLLDASSELQSAPRSQLRYLVEQLGRGEMLARLAFEELSPPAKQALARAGIRTTDLWRKLDDDVHATPLLDLIEVMEVPRLGTSNVANPSAGQESNHEQR